ncbi:6513_t:CDS:1, partial [Scutellospora calospora]
NIIDEDGFLNINMIKEAEFEEVFSRDKVPQDSNNSKTQVVESN